jgi:hypothetical protein
LALVLQKFLGKICRTDHTAAEEHHEEGLERAGRAHDPWEPNEEEDAENVLQAGNVAEESKESEFKAVNIQSVDQSIK